VTKWSQPDRNGQRWPSEAELVVGWKGVSEAFKSKIYCVPGKVVEAVGGGAQTTLPRHEIVHHDTSNAGSEADNQSILSHLLTRWTVREARQNADETEINLAIEFQFSNPIYSAMSSAVQDRVAGHMIEAFEERVRSLLKDGTDGSLSGKVAANVASR
jgi:coenzyme Q-binding protein COQ10